jgi:hypothetical protein
MEVFESIFARSILLDHVLYLLREDFVLLFLFVCLGQYRGV